LFHQLAAHLSAGVIFSEQEVRILLAELYLALEHLHRHNIVHRDVKMENIMLTAEGHVRLVDFGLALEIHNISSSSASSSSSSSQIITNQQHMEPRGSLIYMAPELINERTGGRHTDWWAYGVLAHELLTGKSPWSNVTDKKVIKYEIINLALLPPRGSLSPEASYFITSLMCRNVNNRLGTKADSEIKKCSFFSSIDWIKLAGFQLAPAFVPSQPVKHSRQLQSEKAALSAYCKIVNCTNPTPANSWNM
jgi:serine/threonine protein kinase